MSKMYGKVDRKILFELDKNSRRANAEIARNVDTSKQVVGYHIKKLCGGPIKKSLTILDLSKLGLIVHKVYLRLMNASEEDEIRIAKYLEDHQNVAWLVRTEGIYDIACAFHTRDVVELTRHLQDFEEKFGSCVSERIVNRVVGGEFFHRDYLIEGKSSGFREPVFFHSGSLGKEIDEIDWKILRMLTQESRIPVVDISKQLPISADAVGRRIKLLEREGIITNYTIVLDGESLGQLHYKILLRTGSFPADTESRFKEFCKGHPHITFYNKSIGGWDVEIDMEVPTSAHFREIMRQVKQEFSIAIKEYFSLMIYDLRKFNFLPMASLDQ